MALTKAKIIKDIMHKNSYTKNQATEAVETLFEIIKGTLESGEDVLISGFGKFCVKEKKERKVRNPSTNEPMILGPMKAVTFRCSAKLRERINSK